MVPEEEEKGVRRILKIQDYLRAPRKILIFENSIQIVLRFQGIEIKERRPFSAWLTRAKQFQKVRYYCNDNLEKGKKQILNILNLDYAARHFTKRKKRKQTSKKSRKRSCKNITKNYIYLINTLIWLYI